MLFAMLTLAAYGQRPKVAVVLCGGGAKGAAHVGVLRVLEEYDIPIDMIAGTSMGALVGGLYAVGHPVAEIDSLITSQDWGYVLSGAPRRSEISYEQKSDQAKYLIQIPFGVDLEAALSRLRQGSTLAEDDGDPDGLSRDSFRFAPEGAARGLLPTGLLAGQNVYNLISDLTVGYHDERDFGELPIPFACVATDLVSGNEVVFNKGILPIAMRASMSIPGVFTPVKTDDMMLVDGGMRNNFPVDVARAMGADIVIGVKMQGEDDKDLSDVANLFSKLITITTTNKLSDALADTDILIQPEIGGYSTMSFDNKALRELIDYGEKAAREAAPQLIKLKEYLQRKEAEHDQAFVGPMPAPRSAVKATRLSDTITLHSIHFVGISPEDEQYILRRFNLREGDHTTIHEIEAAANELYATKAYTSVVYSLGGEKSPFDLTMTLVPNRNNRLGLGLRFDTEEISSILFDFGFNYNSLYGHRLGLQGRLSNYYRLDVSYSYQWPNAARIGAGYKLRHGAMALPAGGRERYSTLDYLQNTFDFSLATGNFRRAKVQAGLRGDIFYYRTTLDQARIPDVYSTDDSRTGFFGPYIKIDADNLDNAWFPTSGVKFSTDISYMNDLKGGVGYSPFLDASLSASWVGALSDRFVIEPFVRSRLLLGEQLPVVWANAIGGTQAGRYNERQMPFLGTTGLTAVEPLLAIAGIDARYNLFKSNYLLLGGNYARSASSLQGFFEGSGMAGVRLGYAYDFILGPLEFDLNWNSITRKPGVYLSLGYWF